MNLGDIYLLTRDPTAGGEQTETCPVLVISPTAFNKKTQAPIVLPITNGGSFARRLAFAVQIDGIPMTGVIRCDQPRTIDLAARKARKIGTLPTSILQDVMARLAAIFA